MGKTKTAVISATEDKTSGKEAYEKKKQAQKTKVPGMGGGERIKSVEGEITTDREAIEQVVRKKGQDGRGKAYKNAKKKLDKDKLYKPAEAVKAIKEVSYTKFKGTMELHMVVKKEGMSEQVTLPHSTGKEKRIELADEKTIEKLKKGKVDFDILLATADMMPKLVPFAKILGPKGLMPNPKAGTLLKDKKDADKFNTNKITVKTERKAPLMHVAFGKMDQDDKKLTENLNAILDTIGRRRILKAYVTGSMTPSVKLDVNG